uniref:CD80-like immunoglobulin C2-set domain-containing protein n=1 Tax=Chrysemys picta bellii TaxID=8478 RepID=A0A8C3F422_CHRPI
PFSSTRVYGIQLTDLRAYNVTCRVLNVAPVTHLTVTLRRGGETLHTETFQSHTGTGPDNITVITEITPQRRDHGQEITCHTALDLTPHGSHFENSSSAVELKVYGEFPHAPCARHTVPPCTRDTAPCARHTVPPRCGTGPRAASGSWGKRGQS